MCAVVPASQRIIPFYTKPFTWLVRHRPDVANCACVAPQASPLADVIPVQVGGHYGIMCTIYTCVCRQPLEIGRGVKKGACKRVRPIDASGPRRAPGLFINATNERKVEDLRAEQLSRVAVSFHNTRKSLSETLQKYSSLLYALVHINMDAVPGRWPNTGPEQYFQPYC
jgi:hypothetical protein